MDNFWSHTFGRQGEMVQVVMCKQKLQIQNCKEFKLGSPSLHGSNKSSVDLHVILINPFTAKCGLVQNCYFVSKFHYLNEQHHMS